MNDHEIAGLLAREAGELLLELRKKGLDKDHAKEYCLRIEMPRNILNEIF